MSVAPPSREVSRNFVSLSEWVAWLHLNPWVIDPALISGAVAEIAAHGLIDPLFGYVPPTEIVIGGENYREGIAARGQNSRLRAVSHVLTDEILSKGPSLRVYASEWVSPFAQTVRGFVDYVGSEYLPSAEDRAAHPDIRHEDVTALSFPDQSFDAYITNEVLEHVPDVEAALKEAFRILKPSGLFFGTFPMAFMSETAIRKAEIVNGEIVHLTEPEYHGNPIDPTGGSLVFSIPAWDVVAQAKAAGFADPHIRFVLSRRHGVVGAGIAGILLFCARR